VLFTVASISLPLLLVALVLVMVPALVNRFAALPSEVSVVPSLVKLKCALAALTIFEPPVKPPLPSSLMTPVFDHVSRQRGRIPAASKR